MTWRPVAPPPLAVPAQYATAGGGHSRIRPFNTVAPTVTGTVQAGNTVTAALGTWDGDATITYAQKWLLNGIDDATTSTRALVTGDAGKALRLLVTATNGVGSTQALSAAYTVLAAVAYATWNPADKSASVTLSGGNLVASGCSLTAAVRATLGVSSGKWYWEITNASSYFQIVGVGHAAASLAQYTGQTVDSWGVGEAGFKYHNGATSWGVSFTNQTLGLALDMDAGTLTLYKNGVSQGTPWTGITGTVYPMVSGDTGSAAGSITANFGATAFAYTPPVGFSGLHT